MKKEKPYLDPNFGVEDITKGFHPDENDIFDPSMSIEKAQIQPDDWEKQIPTELKARVDNTVISGHGFYHDYRWLSDSYKLQKEGNIYIFIKDYKKGDNYFEIHFGFVKGGKDLKDPKKNVNNDRTIFEFCSIFIDNPFSIPSDKKGSWGRNTFKDSDYKLIVKDVFRHDSSAGNLYKLITDLKLVRYNISSLNLSDGRIKGKFIGPKEDLVIPGIELTKEEKEGNF